MAPNQDSGTSSSNSTGNTPVPPNATGMPAQSNSRRDEDLRCRWGDCSEHFADASQLYEHVCERHVGRKSTNNLNLTCQWNGCQTTTVKRDHITSHIRVHIPLKPYGCPTCSKSFKRPQDLKKHQKTHADDSIGASRSAQDQNGGLGQGYRTHQGRAPATYYDYTGNQVRANPTGVPQQDGVHPGYYNQPAYGNGMFYPQQSMAPRNDYMRSQPGAYDNRNNRSYAISAAVDELLKRRDLNTASYNQISDGLMPLRSALGGGGGGATMGFEYYQSGMVAVDAPGGGPVAGPLTQHYSLPVIPLAGLRTKDQLMNTDAWLSQMQVTTFESSGSPPETYTPAFEARHPSPIARPTMPNDHFTSGASSVQSPLSSHSGDSPASSGPFSGHSPNSSTPGIPPMSRQSSAGGSIGYPTLPLPPMPATSYQSSAMPPSVGPRFPAYDQRRYSGGVLQKASAVRWPERDEIRDDVERQRAPKAGPSPKAEPPAVSVGSPSEESESSGGEPESYETWVENMRVIEFLRDCIKRRLEARDYDREYEEPRVETKARPIEPRLYPTLPMIAD